MFPLNVEINSFRPDGLDILFLEASQSMASYGFKSLHGKHMVENAEFQRCVHTDLLFDRIAIINSDFKLFFIHYVSCFEL